MTNPDTHATIPHDHWRVSVETSGEHIVSIEPEMLAGREPSDADTIAIRTAAHHLLAFIGDHAQPQPVAYRWRGIGEWLFGCRAPEGLRAEPLYLAATPSKVLPPDEAKEEMRLSAASIRKWMPETLPANEAGQIHFARLLAESAAEAIERFIASSEGSDNG